MSTTRRTGIAFALSFAICTCLATRALAGPDDKGMQMPKPPPSAAQPALDQLKKLQGQWVFAGGDQAGKLGVIYTVSSGGTAVVETLFPGTNHEMVTIYHLDGDKVMMTHYCAAGNQPQMHAESNTQKLVFTCTGGSNMKETDGHMHAMTMTFVDDDHLTEEWTWKSADGQSGTEPFTFERKKG